MLTPMRPLAKSGHPKYEGALADPHRTDGMALAWFWSAYLSPFLRLISFILLQRLMFENFA